ncbi:MAG TPA: hypothetical protein VF021_10725 [Longimicrobiales bacterium]
MKRAVLFAVCVFAAGACAGAGTKDSQKVSLTFQAQLDSGNAAYRRQDYKASVGFYQAAAKAEPENISGWYGIYMAETKLGNKEAAAKAREVVAAKAPYMPLTAHPTAASHPAGALNAPSNPHVPQGGATRAELPIDSLRAAKEKQ